MMKKNVLFGIFVIAFVINFNVVEASSGFLRKDSIKSCNGITYGQHGSDNHCHVAIENSGGGYNASGNPIYQDPCANFSSSGSYNSDTQNNSNPVIVPKSSDVSLNKVVLNDDEIPIQDIMSYETKEESVSLIVVTNDSKSIATYDSLVDLNIGNNEVIINVTAEDGTNKNYLLNINRIRNLSSNNNAIIRVDNEVINFNNGESAVINVLSSVDKLDIDYTLEDNKAKAKIIDNNLKEGENKVIIRVTAENGDVKDYIINVDKSNFLEDVISTIVSIAILVGFCYLIYLFIKKRKLKKK